MRRALTGGRGIPCAGLAMGTFPKFNSSPLKSYLPNRRVVFQPSIFRGYVKLRGCNSTTRETRRGFLVEEGSFHDMVFHWKPEWWIHLKVEFLSFNAYSRWCFQIFFIFIPTWGNDPFWLIFLKWVETTKPPTSTVIDFCCHDGFAKIWGGSGLAKIRFHLPGRV